MKKYTITLHLLFFCSISFCQSLTLKDLSHIVNNADADVYLTTKGFVKQRDFNGFDMYTLNHGTPQEEQFYYDKRACQYKTYDKKYVETLEKQIKKQYRLILRDDLNEFEIYAEYGSSTLHFTIDISKKQDRFSKITIGKGRRGTI